MTLLFVWCLTSLVIVTKSSEIVPLGISGVVAATYTPFDSNFDLDVSVVPCQAAYLNATGVKWIFLGGTTGESVSLSKEERIELINAWMEAAETYEISVIVMVGSDCLRDARSLAAHCESIYKSYKSQGKASPLKGISSIPQSFMKPASLEALTLSMKYVSDGAPSLPFYYYNIPHLTYVKQYTMYDFISYARSKDINFTNFVGLKYTGLYTQPGFSDMHKTISYFQDEFEMISGRDEMVLQALITGAKSMIGLSYNYGGELYNKLLDEYYKPNHNLTKLHYLQTAGIELLDVVFGVPGDKNGHKYLNGKITQCNTGDARFPFLPMADKDKQYIDSNFASWCLKYGDLVSFCPADCDA